MPELPEVEILARHLDPLLRGKTIRDVHVWRAKVINPTSEKALSEALTGARIQSVRRRGKFLLFDLKRGRRPFELLGHLGMTGRMFVQPAREPPPKHTAVSMSLGARQFVYQDTRYFGRFTLDLSSLEKLGPEPLEDEFDPVSFRAVLKRSGQAIKVKLLDQSLVVGVGNIYASEALYRAGISPRKAARRLTIAETEKLFDSIRSTLGQAIECGSTIPLDFAGQGTGDGMFYYGSAAGSSDYQHEQLRVYDREGEPCSVCSTPIKRIVQAARSTFFCGNCQR
jgi:formamidopyrimidine-DNA glycosylase